MNEVFVGCESVEECGRVGVGWRVRCGCGETVVDGEQASDGCGVWEEDFVDIFGNVSWMGSSNLDIDHLECYFLAIKRGDKL